MEAKFTLDVHADADTLEEHAFGRLPEAVSDALEEHLLICPRCQRAMADVDEYILLMKYATARLARDRGGSRLDSGLLRSRWVRLGMGATAAAVVLGSFAFWPSRRLPGPSSVQLIALRGDDTASITQARGGPLDLVIDVSDLPGVGKFRLEVVNAAGWRQWNGTAAPSDGKLTVRVPKGLGRGSYWVRLSASGGELLREFGLRAD